MNKVEIVAKAMEAQKSKPVELLQDAAVEEVLFVFHPGPLETWIFLTAVVCNVLVILATFGLCSCRRFLRYKGSEAYDLVRHYLQKMSMYNMLILAILYILYKIIFTRTTDNDDEMECLLISEHKFLIFAIIIGSLTVGLIRHLAVGFAHSEKYPHIGQHHGNKQKENVPQGFSAVYRRLISPYLKLALVVMIITIIYLFVSMKFQFKYPVVLEQPICLLGWSKLEKERSHLGGYIVFLFLFLLPILAVLGLEHCLYVKTKGFFSKVPGYYAILNAPFVVVAMCTTWSMWCGISVGVLLFFGLEGPEEYFSILTLIYTCLDSIWLCCICFIIGRQNRS